MSMKGVGCDKTEDTYAVDLMKPIHVELTYKARELGEVRMERPRGSGWDSHCCA